MKVFKIDLTTANDGSGTFWRLFRYDVATKRWLRVGLGPDGFTYGDKSRYVTRICVSPATHAFVMRDTNGQQPNYIGYFKGSPIFKKADDFSDRKVHYFTYTDDSGSTTASTPTPPPTPQPSPQPTPVPTRQPSPKPTPRPVDPNFSGRLADCKWNERLFTISIKADQYANEISWNLKDGNGNIVLENSRAYKNYETDTVEDCISEGAYKLTMLDSYGDGIIGPGYYKVYIDGVLQFQSERQYKTKTHEFAFGSQDMTERDHQWLDSHNTRRKTWCVGLVWLLFLCLASTFLHLCLF